MNHQVADVHRIETELLDVLSHAAEEEGQVVRSVVERVGKAEVTSRPAGVSHQVSVGADRLLGRRKRVRHLRRPDRRRPECAVAVLRRDGWRARRIWGRTLGGPHADQRDGSDNADEPTGEALSLPANWASQGGECT